MMTIPGEIVRCNGKKNILRQVLHSAARRKLRNGTAALPRYIAETDSGFPGLHLPVMEPRPGGRCKEIQMVGDTGIEPVTSGM